MSGYSGTPLAKKLGFTDGSKIVLVGAPANYLSLVAPISDWVQFGSRVSATTDIVHVFCTRRAELHPLLVHYRDKLAPTAAVWVSWPKKSSKVATDITEDTIRELALPLGFVDVKVCAIDNIWSGLKLVVRKLLR
jgi:hypothetical protein